MGATVISVWGATGAPGRTTVAINVAAELASQGKKVALLDADTYGGAVATYLAVREESSALATLCRLAEADALDTLDISQTAHVVKCQGQPLHVFTGITRPERWVEISASRLKNAISFLQSLYEVIVLDLGFNLEADEEISSDVFAPRRNAATLSALNSSDVVLEVVANNPLGLSRFIRAHAKLEEEYPDIPKITVLNLAESSLMQSDAAKSLQRFAGMREIYQIREDRQSVETSQRKGLPLSEAASKSLIRKDLQILSGKLLSSQFVD